ncbi:hypothetical protein [Paenibacillus luteus]|uniref:hypothetical protein n=1 Tax=Paenibacillus luteus TaxID=2545753 RepID=UPI0011427D21|nr:hypothetical protein [Paenibacillus luteus]
MTEWNLVQPSAEPVREFDSVAIDLFRWQLGAGEQEAEDGVLASEQSFLFQYPGVTQDNHWRMHGFVPVNELSTDLRDWYGLELELLSGGRTTLELRVDIGFVMNKSPMPETIEWTSANRLITGDGKLKVVLPFEQFDDLKSQAKRWRFVRTVRISFNQMDETNGREEAGFGIGEICLQQASIIRRQAVWLSCPVLSKSAEPGDSTVYDIEIVNVTSAEQGITLIHEKQGWEEMPVSLSAQQFMLRPNERRSVQLSVEVTKRIAPGGFEKQRIYAIPSGAGDKRESLELTTVRSLAHPYILMTEPEWEQVKHKIAEQPWAAELLVSYVERAERWGVPETHDGEYMFITEHSHEARNAAIAWKLTGEAAFAAKAVMLLRRVVDPLNGYPGRLRVSHQELVHEGELFKHLAIAYDLLYDCGLFTDEDRKHIESSFRLFMDLIDWEIRGGSISNWTLAELAGAAYCAQVLQDRERMERFIFGSGGALEHLAKGTMDDGWWYECSIGYNLMAAGLFSEMAQSCRPWGINLTDMWVSASYYEQVSSGERPTIDGLSLEVWGPSTRNYRSISQLWDSLLPFADYRGVLFGINDSAESKLLGVSHVGSLDPRYDLAYYHYRKPEYVHVLRTSDVRHRDLLYAPAELPEDGGQAYLSSAYADNAGVAVLRSRKAGRTPREQLQAVVKYGSHGGAHGHYDRVSLLSLMRFGKSFYNPESVWYSYRYFMYKFFVQNSITHNMVVVDLKQQDPSEAKRQLFHTGHLFQACAVENSARWCNPPYGGWLVKGDKTLQERSWHEGRYVPVPEQAPPYTSRTEYTEPIVQRRMTIVTDDYVVLFDYMRGDQEHTYDCLFHIKGLRGITAKETTHVAHTEQLSTNPLGSAQFITDCDWYEVEGPVTASFEMAFGEGSDNEGNRTLYNEDGVLKMDVHTVWPPRFELITGTDPEYFKVEKKLWYEVRGDGKTLASGQFGAWILGRDDLDLAVAGVESLHLRVKIAEVRDENEFMTKTEKTIFWGDPYFVLADGTKVYAAELPFQCENVDPGHGMGKDYRGGPVKLRGKTYTHAVPGNPDDIEREGVIIFDLTGLGAIRFVSAIGGDYPLGDETYRRKLLSARTKGEQTRFTTVIEPFESNAMIAKAEATSADTLRVELVDGRVQEISLTSFEGSGERIHIILKEYNADGELIGEEETL